MDESYKTITKTVHGEITEKKSRFIATLSPAKDLTEALQIVELTKKKYHDARHNCYACIIGNDSSGVKYSDDGEPQGTAGRPMLEVLKGNSLTYVCAVVTRYFGGILLGPGGLSRAYSGALSEALSNAEIITMSLQSIIKCTVPYTLTGKLGSYFEKKSITIKNTDYTESVCYTLALPPSLAPETINDLTEFSQGSAIIERAGEEYAPSAL